MCHDCNFRSEKQSASDSEDVRHSLSTDQAPALKRLFSLHLTVLPSTTRLNMADSASEYVTLISHDDYEFIIPRSAACISGTIRRMLDPSSTWIPDPVLRGLY